jgi:ribosome biogenesis GTPase
MTGLVYKSTGSWYTVKSMKGILECRIKENSIKGIKSTNPIAVGDVVDYEMTKPQMSLRVLF